MLSFFVVRLRQTARVQEVPGSILTRVKTFDTSIVAYADDMYFIYEADTWEGVSAMASRNTKKAMEWLKKSGMVLNSSKTESSILLNQSSYKSTTD